MTNLPRTVDAAVIGAGHLWLHDQTSATLFGVARDAQVLAARMGIGAVERPPT